MRRDLRFCRYTSAGVKVAGPVCLGPAGAGDHQHAAPDSSVTFSSRLAGVASAS
jgi:hypothetical protein